MRHVWLGIGFIALSGCRFDWRADVDTGCPELRTWYLDADADGWGAAGASIVSCAPEGQFTVRNDRDCDDGDGQVTGRVGSICPDRLVADPTGAASTAYTGVRIGDREVVVVHAGTAPVVARAAEDACGRVGWGGALAALPTDAAIIELLDALPAGTTRWAGYVGAVYDDGEERWVWRTGDTFPESRLCTFDGDGTPGAEDYDPALGFLALVRNGPATEWCLGTPDEAHGGAPCAAGETCYDRRYGHFACERPPPDAAAYTLPADGAVAGG